HEVAHGCLKWTGDGFVLAPYCTISSMMSAAQLTVGQLTERAASFSALALAIKWMAVAIALRRGNAAAALPPAPNQVLQIQRLIAQTPASKPPPPRSY